MMTQAIDIAAKRAAFQHYFGLSPAQAGVLVLLFNAKGGFLTTAQLAALESTNCDAILIRVNRLRDAMEAEAVDSVRGQGFRLSDVGVHECRTAMGAMSRSLAAADEQLRLELLEDFRL